uniref:NADH dehydrogenase [ubiquinone] 1 beta subcomplex subunit 9 n=1 Tax=Myxine glutinosa TaxID=7769 RepID=UPI00358DFE03
MAALLSHQQRVCRFYKRAIRNLESWVRDRAEFRFQATILRSRIDAERTEPDQVRAVRLLQDAERELWHNLHPLPYRFPSAPGGTMYERYDCYKAPEWVLDLWHPTEKAAYPDYFTKREKWKQLREKSWPREVQQLQEETPKEGPMNEALPPARRDVDLPPFWWSEVTRPREMP